MGAAQIAHEAYFGKLVELGAAEKIHLTECDEDPDTAAWTMLDSGRRESLVVLRQVLADLVTRDNCADDRECKDAADRIDAIDAIVENEVVANDKRIDNRECDAAVTHEVRHLRRNVARRDVHAVLDAVFDDDQFRDEDQTADRCEAIDLDVGNVRLVAHTEE